MIVNYFVMHAPLPLPLMLLS